MKVNIFTLPLLSLLFTACATSEPAWRNPAAAGDGSEVGTGEQPKLFAENVQFWADHSKTEGLSELGDFVAETSTGDVEELDLVAFRALKAELAKLSPPPTYVKLDKNHSYFAASVKGCSVACLELLRKSAPTMGFRSISVDPYSEKQFIGATKFSSGLRKAVEARNAEEVNRVLFRSTYGKFLKLEGLDAVAIEQVFLSSDGPDIVESYDYIDGLIDLVRKKHDINTIRTGAYSELGQVPAVREAVNRLYLGAKLEEPTVANGDYLLKGNRFATHAGPSTQYYRVPARMTALEYLLIKNHITERNRRDGKESIAIELDPNPRDPTKPFVWKRR